MKKKELLEVKLPKVVNERYTLITRKKGNGLVIGIYYMHELVVRLWLGKQKFLCVIEHNQKTSNKNLDDVFWTWKEKIAGFRLSYTEFSNGLVVSEKDTAAILKFTGVDYDETRAPKQLLSAIMRHQRDIKSIKKNERIDCESEKVKLVTREPKGFEEWLSKQEVIFLIRGRNGKTSATCSYCHGTWSTSMKGNEAGECPHCKSKGIYKKNDIRSKKFFEYSGVYLGRNKNGEIVEVVKNCHVTYDMSYLNRSVRFCHGDRRILPVREGAPIYEYCGNGRYKKSYKTFNVRGFMYYRHQQYAYMYQDNVKRLLKGTEFEKYECEKYARYLKGDTSFFGIYIHEMQNSPIAEQIMKGGFREMIYHMILYNQVSIVSDYVREYIVKKSLPEGQSLASAMGLTKTQFNMLRKEKFANIKVALTAYMNKQIPEISPYVVDTYASLYNLPKQTRNCASVPVGPVVRNKHMLTQAFADYLNKVDDSAKLKFLKDYEDYYGWLTEMNYPMNKTYLRPKDFRKKHDEMEKLHNEFREAQKRDLLRKESEYMSQIKPIVEELFKIPLSDDNYEIIVPSCREDLINESEKLHHCVRNYSKQIFEHSCVIVFIRKKANINTPFYTMEINKYCNIQQCRTTKNDSYVKDDEMREIVISYEKAMKEKVQKEKYAELLEQLQFQAAA